MFNFLEFFCTSFFTKGFNEVGLNTTPWKKAVPSRNCKKAIFPLERLLAIQAPIFTVSPTCLFESII